MSKEKDVPEEKTQGFTADLLQNIDFSSVDWEKEIKYIGALSGSVIGSFVSTQLSWSLGLRIATVVGSSYSGAVLATLGYQLFQKLTEEE